MKYRRFGQTELNLSVFSLGTMRLSSAEVAEATIARAIELGINHVETARGYGESERYVGQALKSLTSRSPGLEHLPDRKLHITTKLSPTGDRDTTQRHLEESLCRLQVTHIDCVALHGINTPEHLAAALAPNGALSALAEAREQGLIQHIGFSTHGERSLIEAAINSGHFSFVNLHYYYFFQRHAPAIARAEELDLGIFIISPTDKGGQLYAPPDKLRQLCAPFSPQELNYRFLLSDRRITTLSLGAACPEEVEVSLADMDSPLSPEESAVLERLETQAKQALGSDRCSQCYACLPCPEAINIPEVLRLRNLAIAYDMQSFGQYRYRMFENAGHWFPGRKANHCSHCGDCLPRCPENLEIPRLLQDTHQKLAGPKRRRLWE